MVSISRKGNCYHVSLMGEEECVDYEEIVREALDVNNSIGLDFSLEHLFVTSEGEHIDAPSYYENSLTKLAKEQRKLSHMVKDSKNYLKQKQKIDNLHNRITNQRKDFLHKVSRRIANKYDYVLVEDLDLKEMSSSKTKYKFGLRIFDLGYSTFLNFLSYKLDWLNKKIIKVNRYFPSSKRCNECYYKNEELKLSQRSWVCPMCGKKHDRDINAAINIKKEGIRMVLEAFN
jgi:putative transposase